MKKIYLGMIIVCVLTLFGCSTNAMQQRNDQLSNPLDGPTTTITSPTPTLMPTPATENAVTPNAVKYYSDEDHKIVNIDILSVDLDPYHIVSETFNGSDYTIEYKENQSSSSNDSPVENMIIKEMKSLKLMDKESIKSYLIKMMPSYENIRIYNNITDDSGITYLSVISGGGKTYCIVNFGDTSYLIDSNINTIEWFIFTTPFYTANYEEIKQNVECANSFSTSIHEIIDYDTETVKYDIIQGKNGKKYSAELNFGGDDGDNFTLKNDNDKNILNITLGGGEPNEAITFIDVNLDGYADIQVLDKPGAMNNSNNLYVWDESVNNFVKVKCDTGISYFEVNEGCLVTWERGGYDSGIQTILIWKDNKTLVKESEEEYHADDSSDSEENLNILVDNGLIVFEDQAFSTEFETFGNVRFVSGGVEGDKPFELRLYLTDNNGNVIYSFSNFYGNRWPALTELSAVAFKDVNNDGLKDIIIIAYYMTGVGENGAEEFPVAGIYLQREKEFIDISEINELINAEGKNENIDEVIKFTKSIDFSKYSESKSIENNDFISGIKGTWTLEKIALVSEILMFPSEDDVDSPDLQDNTEQYVGMQLEIEDSFLRLCENEYLNPDIIVDTITLKEFNDGGEFILPDAYSFILDENISINNSENYELLSEVPLEVYTFNFDEDYDIPISTQFVIINNDTMFIGLWGKIILAKRIIP